jgi:hypothetical protein
VMEVHIETVDGDLSTSVQPLPGSYLSLRASCSWIQDWDMRPELNFNKDPHRSMLSYDGVEDPIREVQGLPLVRSQIVISLDRAQHRSLFSRSESNICFLLIADTNGPWASSDRQLWCLILRSDELGGECRYVRLGVARMLRGKDLPEPEWEERLVKTY